jgi:hypothetical protein
MGMNKGGGGGGKGGGFTPTIDLSQFQQFAPQAPTMQQSNYNPMMDMYGSATQVMQPMPGYYNQYPIQGSNYQPYQPYQPPQVAAPVQPPVQPPAQVGSPVQPPWAQQGPQQGSRVNNQNFSNRRFPREDNTPYSTMPVSAPIYMPSTRPPELQQSYAAPQTQMPILDQASAGFAGYSKTPRFNFGQGFNFGASM